MVGSAGRATPSSFVLYQLPLLQAPTSPSMKMVSLCLSTLPFSGDRICMCMAEHVYRNRSWRGSEGPAATTVPYARNVILWYFEFLLCFAKAYHQSAVTWWIAGYTLMTVRCFRYISVCLANVFYNVSRDVVRFPGFQTPVLNTSVLPALNVPRPKYLRCITGSPSMLSSCFSGIIGFQGAPRWYGILRTRYHILRVCVWGGNYGPQNVPG